MPTDVDATSYLVESVFIEACLAGTSRTTNIDHFHTDAENGWPLISVKAVLAEEDPALIRELGEPCEIFNVYIVAEWPITAEAAGVLVSAAQLSFLAREISVAIRSAGDTDAIEEFTYFEIEPLQEGEKEVEADEEQTPTRRVDIASFQCIVLRASS